jgi:hypothetical protein
LFPGYSCLKRIRSVHRARATDRTADLRAIERFIDDLANGARAPSALRAAAKATINMARRPARRGARRASHLMVAQYIAGADNHHAPCSEFANRCVTPSQNKNAF